jgi:hypothetical protein
MRARASCHALAKRSRLVLLSTGFWLGVADVTPFVPTADPKAISVH